MEKTQRKWRGRRHLHVYCNQKIFSLCPFPSKDLNLSIKNFLEVLSKPFNLIQNNEIKLKQIKQIIQVVPPQVLPIINKTIPKMETRAHFKESFSLEKGALQIQDESGFVFGISCVDHLDLFFNSQQPLALAADATHCVARNSSLKLVSICFF